MAIQVQCPNRGCGKAVDVSEESGGKAGQCPACGTSLAGPGSGGSSAWGTGAGVNPSGAAGLWATIEGRCQENGLDATSRNILGGGVLALFFLAISTLL